MGACEASIGDELPDFDDLWASGVYDEAEPPDPDWAWEQSAIDNQKSTISWLTARRYYRRLYDSGRLHTLLRALYRHFQHTSRLDLPHLVATGAVTTDGKTLSTSLSDTWQTRTALLFLQLAYQNLRRLLRQPSRGPFPLRQTRITSSAQPSNAGRVNPQSSINDQQSNSSFLEKKKLSDLNSPASSLRDTKTPNIGTHLVGKHNPPDPFAKHPVGTGTSDTSYTSGTSASSGPSPGPPEQSPLVVSFPAGFPSIRVRKE